MDDSPLHFYRAEFERLNEPDFAAHWREWYLRMAKPIPFVEKVTPNPDAKPFSDAFPFPIEYDSVKAAPNNHMPHYEDAHMRFIEVVIRPGERENILARMVSGDGPEGRCTLESDDQIALGNRRFRRWRRIPLR